MGRGEFVEEFRTRKRVCVGLVDIRRVSEGKRTHRHSPSATYSVSFELNPFN